jgi:hypothetical protein
MQARLKPELELADADSRFRRVEGINVHYKVRLQVLYQHAV